MTVGRDAFAWLAAVPSLASAEIIARRSPLAAYLYRVGNQSLPFRTAGYHLEPNVVYQEGTEKTARALFAYRIGMTMAEWVCRKLMGLGPTIHAEAVPELQGRGPARSQQNGQPDLVGYHWQSPETWLIEAKAARRLGKPELSKGASQLCAAGLMVGPNMRVLCGTSIEHRVFMTVDAEMAAGEGENDAAGDSWGLNADEEDDDDDDDDALLALARSRMLNFYALEALPRESLSIRPVGPAVAASQSPQGRAINLVVPLERDESTRIERLIAQDEAAYARRPPWCRFDMLTGQVPGTDLVMGISRRLFAACRSLATEQAQLLLEVQAELPDLPMAASGELIAEEKFEDRLRERRTFFAGQEANRHERLRAKTRQAYEIGWGSSWQQLLDSRPRLVAESPANMLECATQTHTWESVPLQPHWPPNRGAPGSRSGRHCHQHSPRRSRSTSRLPPSRPLPLFVIDGHHVNTVVPLLAGYALLMVVTQVRLPPAYRWLSFMPSFWGVHILLGDGHVRRHVLARGDPSGWMARRVAYC